MSERMLRTTAAPLAAICLLQPLPGMTESATEGRDGQTGGPEGRETL